MMATTIILPYLRIRHCISKLKHYITKLAFNQVMMNVRVTLLQLIPRTSKVIVVIEPTQHVAVLTGINPE